MGLIERGVENSQMCPRVGEAGIDQFPGRGRVEAVVVPERDLLRICVASERRRWCRAASRSPAPQPLLKTSGREDVGGVVGASRASLRKQSERSVMPRFNGVYRDVTGFIARRRVRRCSGRI